MSNDTRYPPLATDDDTIDRIYDDENVYLMKEMIYLLKAERDEAMRTNEAHMVWHRAAQKTIRQRGEEIERLTAASLPAPKETQ